MLESVLSSLGAVWVGAGLLHSTQGTLVTVLWTPGQLGWERGLACEALCALCVSVVMERFYAFAARVLSVKGGCIPTLNPQLMLHTVT